MSLFFNAREENAIMIFTYYTVVRPKITSYVKIEVTCISTSKNRDNKNIAIFQDPIHVCNTAILLDTILERSPC